MEIKPYVTKMLGDNSYVVISDGEAVIIDPQRDIWRYFQLLEDNNFQLKYVFETHVHNDYISGALELKDRYSHTQLLVPKKGEYEFEHQGVENGDIVQVGKIKFEVLDTPGHTYEHISWIARQNHQEIAAFTGGSLIIGSVGRTDLLGNEHVDELTKLQYESIMKLKKLPSHTKIFPTHGAGSFCTSTNPSKLRFSTLSAELESNQALTAKSLSIFSKHQLSNLKLYPRYYVHMAGINRKGPQIFGKLFLPPALDVVQFVKEIENSLIIDLREGRDFAKGHIPGSYNFEFRKTTGNYIGWIVPFNHPLLIVPDNDETHQIREITTQLFRIGYVNLVGYLRGGILSWKETEKPLNSYNAVSVEELKNQEVDERNILDVRQPAEFQEFNIPGSKNMFVANIPQVARQLEDHHFIICTSGQRSAIAASLLKRMGKNVTLVFNGGVDDFND